MAPRIKVLGDRLDPGSVGPRQVAQLPASKQASPPIYEARWARNGKSPDAMLLNLMGEAANQGCLFRTRQFWNILGKTGGCLASASGTRVRWRSSFRTSPWAHAIAVLGVMAPPTDGLDQDTYSTLTIDDGSSTIGTAEFHYGMSPSGGTAVVEGWQHLRQIWQYITLDPSTEYNATFRDVNYGRLQSACVIELPSLTSNFSGYAPQNITNQTPIVHKYRENLATMTRGLWQESGAHVLNWAKDTLSAPSTTSATYVNVLDNAITSVTASSPGFKLQLSNHARLSQSGVPVKMKVYGLVSSGVAGEVALVNSGGVVGTVGSFTTTPSWKNATFTISDADDKLDLQFRVAGGVTLTVQAVSVFELD